MHTVQTSNASAITGPDYDLAVAGEHEEPVLSYFFLPLFLSTLLHYEIITYHTTLGPSTVLDCVRRTTITLQFLGWTRTARDVLSVRVQVAVRLFCSHYERG